MDTVVKLVSSDVEVDEQGRELREYFCRVCNAKAKGYTIPLGWFVVRKTHNVEDGPRTVGLYDTSKCLAVDILSKELRITIPHARVLLVANEAR